MTSYKNLLEKFKAIAAIDQAAGVIGWDQEVMMPKNGSELRAEQLRALSIISHQLVSDPIIGEELEKVQMTPENEPHIREIKRRYESAVRLPEKLVGEIAYETSRAQKIWFEARKADNFSAFAPTLEKIIRLTREKASHLAKPDQSHYDALLDEFEPGMSTSELDHIFGSLETSLIALSEKISEKPNPKAIKGNFDTKKQLELCHLIAQNIGFRDDWSRLDLSAHPFSSGHFDDCRVTTRLDEKDPLGSIYSTLHEMGHALYEHGISRDLALTPAGIYCSMGIHESQSRFAENQIGRSHEYTNWLFPHFKAALGDGGLGDEQAFYAAINRVERGFIRTDADEVHYNLHVILRFHLERALISGELNVDELEPAWNEKFRKMFGLKVDRASNGVLQDIHWSTGAFGYFPTYTLGNIYAACLGEALRKAMPDLNEQLQQGDQSNWVEWMRVNIHQYGRLQSATALLENATGQKPTAEPLIVYLNQKFTAL